MNRRAINAALRVAGPQVTHRDAAHRRAVAMAAARAVAGKVSHELRDEILVALDAWPPPVRTRYMSCPMISKRKGSAVQIWSLFSGGMGLDIGLEQAGLPAGLAVDIDRDCRATIAANRPHVDVHPVGDVTTLSGSALRDYRSYQGEVFLMAGGPPCQSFSTGGNRAALTDPRGNLIYTYLGLIQQVRPRYFILENVANLVTAAISHRPISERPGQHWSLKKYAGRGAPTESGVEPLAPEEMSGSAVKQILNDMRGLGYGLSFGVLNTAEFGAPQKRLRFVMLGALEADPPALPNPTHGIPGKPVRTVRDAIYDLLPNPGPHSIYTPEVAAIFRDVPVGGNWRDLPDDIVEDALGASFSAGGGKTGFYRRLPWDAPAPTVTGRANRKATAMCHPSETRPISVREAARLQGFPDEWEFQGSMSSQYMQVGNAVPTQLGKALGLAVLAHSKGKAVATTESMTMQFERAVATLRASARNKVVARPAPESRQRDLFAS